MKLTKELIRQHFGPDVDIDWRFPFAGYKITTRNGGSVVFTQEKFEDLKGGADIWDGVVGLGGALWGSVTVNGKVEHVAHARLSGRKLGVPVEAGETKHFFGLLKTPPPALPIPSGVFGSQGLDWTAAHLRAARLLGHGYGEGVRVGACWEDGSPLRYAGEDAENSIIGFGPPGVGKGTCFQIVAGLEFMGSSVWRRFRLPVIRSSSFSARAAASPKGSGWMICSNGWNTEGRNSWICSRPKTMLSAETRLCRKEISQ